MSGIHVARFIGSVRELSGQPTYMYIFIKPHLSVTLYCQILHRGHMFLKLSSYIDFSFSMYIYQVPWWTNHVNIVSWNKLLIQQFVQGFKALWSNTVMFYLQQFNFTISIPVFLWESHFLAGFMCRMHNYDRQCYMFVRGYRENRMLAYKRWIVVHCNQLDFETITE